MLQLIASQIHQMESHEVHSELMAYTLESCSAPRVHPIHVSAPRWLCGKRSRSQSHREREITAKLTVDVFRPRQGQEKQGTESQ